MFPEYWILLVGQIQITDWASVAVGLVVVYDFWEDQPKILTVVFVFCNVILFV